MVRLFKRNGGGIDTRGGSYFARLEYQNSLTPMEDGVGASNSSKSKTTEQIKRACDDGDTDMEPPKQVKLSQLSSSSKRKSTGDRDSVSEKRGKSSKGPIVFGDDPHTRNNLDKER